MNEYIKNRLSEEMILGQLMEECAELIQAAHKIIRQRQGVNLPHSDRDLAATLNEEIGDLLLCINCLEIVNWELISSTVAFKRERWIQRLQEEAGKEESC